MAFDLYAEHDAALRQMRQTHFDWFQAQGVGGHAFVDAGLFGADSVSFEGACYEPTPYGEPAIIQPVIEHDEIVDLLAWSPKQPDRMATRLDYAAVLNLDAVSYADWHKTPLVVHATALDWLRASCNGAVVIDMQRAWAQLHGVSEVTTTDHELATKLRAILRRPWPAPTVSVARKAAAA